MINRPYKFISQLIIQLLLTNMVQRLCLLLVLLSLAASEKITISCQACGRCNIGYCQITDGGPFSSNLDCVSNCTLTSMSFDIGCSCSLSCGYSIILDQISWSGCSDSKDPLWPSIQKLLTSYYLYYGLGSSYSWCGGVCAGQIIGIVAGGVVLVGGGIAIYIYLKRRSARKQNTLMESASRKSERRSAIVIDNNLQ